MANSPLVIRRSTWAAVEQLANNNVIGSASPSHGRGGGSDALILARNNTGDTIPLGGVAGIDGLVTTPDTHGEAWHFYRCYRAVLPDPDNLPFAIALGAIAAGETGQMVLYGEARARVNRQSAAHRFAKPVAGNGDCLHSEEEGPARILFCSVETGLGEALIQFPVGGSGGGGGEPAKLVYIREFPTTGTARVSDVYLTADPEQTPSNWGAFEATRVVRRLVGSEPEYA